MKLTCDACDATFAVPDSAIKPEGRKVKCSKCGHVWIAKLQAEPKLASDHTDEKKALTGSYEGLDEAADEMGLKAIADMLSKEDGVATQNTSNKKHAKATSQPLDKLVKRLTFICFIGIVVASVFAFKSTFLPFLSPLYSALGMVTSEQVIIQKLSYQKIPDDQKDRFTVSGEIVNTADEPMIMPTLRVSLQDEAREAFYSREYEEEYTLKPGEIYPFNVGRIETAFKGKAKFVIVEIGNGYELSARD